MAFVMAPNGDVYDLPDAVASGLVNGSGWEYHEDKPKATKRTTAQSDKK